MLSSIWLSITRLFNCTRVKSKDIRMRNVITDEDEREHVGGDRESGGAKDAWSVPRQPRRQPNSP